MSRALAAPSEPVCSKLGRGIDALMAVQRGDQRAGREAPGPLRSLSRLHLRRSLRQAREYRRLDQGAIGAKASFFPGQSQAPRYQRRTASAADRCLEMRIQLRPKCPLACNPWVGSKGLRCLLAVLEGDVGYSPKA